MPGSMELEGIWRCCLVRDFQSVFITPILLPLKEVLWGHQFLSLNGVLKCSFRLLLNSSGLELNVFKFTKLVTTCPFTLQFPKVCSCYSFSYSLSLFYLCVSTIHAGNNNLKHYCLPIRNDGNI